MWSLLLLLLQLLLLLLLLLLLNVYGGQCGFSVLSDR